MKYRITLLCGQIVSTIFLLCIFPACEQGVNHFPVQARPASSKEARLVDMPFPLGVELQELQQKEGKSVVSRYSVSFETADPIETLFSFYREEMERLGWRMSASFWLANDTLMLSFERPAKIAIISIVPRSGKQLVTCHVSPRNVYTE